jgi:2Fe-2S ferredoxin
MSKLFVATREGSESSIESAPGRSIMEVIRDAGFEEIRALCGGCCACATCHVYVDPLFMDRLPPMDDSEGGLLESSSHRTQYSRLSCQIPFTESLDGLRVQIAPED